MSEEKLIKQVMQEAENDLREKRKKEVKEIVTRTLEKISFVEKNILKLKDQLKELEEEKKLLKLDIDDLKEGRLDRIEERQKKDEKAKNSSIVKVEKVIEHHHHHYDKWWQEPYKITWTQPATYPLPTVYCGNSGVGGILGTVNTYSLGMSTESFTLDASSAKFNTSGTYNVCGKIVHLK